MAEEEIIEDVKNDINESQETIPDEPKSVKESVREAYKEVKEKLESKGEEKEEKPEKVIKTDKSLRDDSGKFSAKEKAPKEVLEHKPIIEKIAAPEAVHADIKAEWEKLSPKAQAALVKREADIHKGMTTMDEERNFAKEMNKTFLPYMPLINSVGSTPSQAITEMLNYAHILQTGTPQAKGQLLNQLAQRHGADLRVTPQVAQQPAYQLQSVQQELKQTKQQLQQLPELIKQQQEKAQLQGVIDAFASDPVNAHYEKVKPIMASLLSSGAAKDMKDAYDRACYADPEIRSTLEAEKTKATEAKRVADIKAKSEKARSASSSIRGLPGMNGAEIKSGQVRSLREELRHNLNAALNH